MMELAEPYQNNNNNQIIINEATANDEKRENNIINNNMNDDDKSECSNNICNYNINYTPRITAKQRREAKRKYYRGPNNILEINPNASILAPQVLKQFKLAVLNNKATIQANHNNNNNKFTPIQYNNINQIDNNDNDKNKDELLALDAKIEQLIEPPSALKRQKTSDHLAEIKHERLVKKLTRKQSKIVLNTKITADVKQDTELSAMFLARFMVDFASNYNIINEDKLVSCSSSNSNSKSKSESIINKSRNKGTIKIQEKQGNIKCMDTIINNNNNYVEDSDNDESIPDIIPIFDSVYSEDSSIINNNNINDNNNYNSNPYVLSPVLQNEFAYNEECDYFDSVIAESEQLIVEQQQKPSAIQTAQQIFADSCINSPIINDINNIIINKQQQIESNNQVQYNY